VCLPKQNYENLFNSYSFFVGQRPDVPFLPRFTTCRDVHPITKEKADFFAVNFTSCFDGEGMKIHKRPKVRECGALRGGNTRKRAITCRVLSSYCFAFIMILFLKRTVSLQVNLVIVLDVSGSMSCPFSEVQGQSSSLSCVDIVCDQCVLTSSGILHRISTRHDSRTRCPSLKPLRSASSLSWTSSSLKIALVLSSSTRTLRSSYHVPNGSFTSSFDRFCSFSTCFFWVPRM